MDTTNQRPFPGITAAPCGTRPAWCEGLPCFVEAGVLIREPEVEDAASLLAHLSTPEVSRFIAPQAMTIGHFERFVHACHRRRLEGLGVCFAAVPEGAARAVGLFEVRGVESGFATSEWNFAVGSAYWGTGLFLASATRVLDFAFETLGVLRLEARAVVINGRGNGALGKLGAVQEGILRRSFLRNGHYHDQVLWSLLAEDWRRRRSLHRTRIH